LDGISFDTTLTIRLELSNRASQIVYRLVFVFVCLSATLMLNISETNQLGVCVCLIRIP